MIFPKINVHTPRLSDHFCATSLIHTELLSLPSRGVNLRIRCFGSFSVQPKPRINPHTSLPLGFKEQWPQKTNRKQNSFLLTVFFPTLAWNVKILFSFCRKAFLSTLLLHFATHFTAQTRTPKMDISQVLYHRILISAPKRTTTAIDPTDWQR